MALQFIPDLPIYLDREMHLPRGCRVSSYHRCGCILRRQKYEGHNKCSYFVPLLTASRAVASRIDDEVKKVEKEDEQYLPVDFDQAQTSCSMAISDWKCSQSQTSSRPAVRPKHPRPGTSRVTTSLTDAMGTSYPSYSCPRHQSWQLQSPDSEGYLLFS